MTQMDKRDRAALFRTRLLEQLAAKGMSRAALARATRVDRSTVAHLLAEDEGRLPNAHLAAECAQALGISSDWLLGLSDRPERTADLLSAAMTVTQAARSSEDRQLLEWHQEAAGYKIRHVPATLPDVLKTEAVLTWEYARFLGKTPAQAITAHRDNVHWLEAQQSDYEIAVPMGELKAFAAGKGYYEGLADEVRAAQLREISEAARTFYPSLRLFFFDSRRVFSAPVTVFGPLLCVIYIGQFYMAFRARDRVQAMTKHFDALIREAEIDARSVGDWIDALAQENGLV